MVVEDCNTGEILAAANYPSFDLNDYYDKYSSLVKRRLKPLYNRFAMGAYAPGSTFKPMMAVAALEEGVISDSTYFTCSKYFRISDMQFKCTDAHGGENVRTALRDSCNVFFYNCSQKLGIERMNQYGSLFGFAIGQSDNLLTPLQLCNYAATIANGGIRYQAHFVKSRISNATGVATQTGANIVKNLNLRKSTVRAVQEGMRLVATKGGPRYVFGKIDTKVACKTGTSQVIVNGVKSNNGFLITYAPYDNPEIAIASAIERAGSGTSTAEVTSSIIDYYYSHNTKEKKAQTEAKLLN